LRECASSRKCASSSRRIQPLQDKLGDELEDELQAQGKARLKLDQLQLALVAESTYDLHKSCFSVSHPTRGLKRKDSGHGDRLVQSRRLSTQVSVVVVIIIVADGGS